MKLRKLLLLSMLMLVGCFYATSIASTDANSEPRAIVIPLEDEIEVIWIKE